MQRSDQHADPLSRGGRQVAAYYQNGADLRGGERAPRQRGGMAGIAKIEEERGHPDVAEAIAVMLRDPAASVKAAEFIASKDPVWNSTLRTTCVATMLSGGHSPNALPQRAEANVNCRIFPGVSGARCMRSWLLLLTTQRSKSRWSRRKGRWLRLLH